MKKALAYITAMLAAAILMCAPAIAGERTAVLSIPDMECGSLEIQANMALSDLKGVKSVDMDSDEKTATVTFDEESVTLGEMGEALGKFKLTLGEVTYPDEE